MPNKPPTHQPPGQQQARRQAEREHNRTDRHKALNTQAYRRFRKYFLAERPSCEDCVARDDGRIAPSAHVHHTRKLANHPEDLLDESHCLALCAQCHNARTGRGE